MPAPAVVGTPTTLSAINGANATLSIPVGAAAGDLLVVAGGHFWRTGVLAGPINAGGLTWTARHESANATTHFGIWTATHDGVATTVVCRNTGNVADGCGYALWAVTGADTSNPVNVVGTQAAAIDPPSITTTVADTLVLAATVISAGDATPGTITGYTPVASVVFGDTNTGTVATTVKTVTAAGVENPAAWSALTATNPKSQTIAFAPAPASGTTGAGAATAPAATATGAGTSTDIGAGAVTAPAGTATGAGTSKTTGSGAATAPPATAAGAGTSTDTGAGTATAPAGTATGVGTSTTTGTGAATAPAGTAAGSAGAPPPTSGEGAATAPEGTATGAGTSTTTGAGTATAPEGTAAGTGVTVVAPVDVDIALTVVLAASSPTVTISAPRLTVRLATVDPLEVTLL